MYPVGYAFVYSRKTPVPHRSILLHGLGLRMDGARTFPSTSFAHGQPLLGLGYDCTDAGMSQTATKSVRLAEVSEATEMLTKKFLCNHLPVANCGVFQHLAK